jgi:F420-0:gamma-glutamyl ligase
VIVRAIKTKKVLPGASTLPALLDESLASMPERSILAVTSKIVSLCEGRTVPMEGTDKDKLIAREAQLYLPREQNRYGVMLSVVRNQLVASAGIDESNSAGQYVLWPSDPWATANEVRAYLRKRFGLKRAGVIITDSTTRPLQWGTTGITIAYSGFKPLHNYTGKKDLFGRRFEHHTNSIQNGLAAAAVVVMGEGSEQTPLATLEELDFVEFVSRNPTQKELASWHIDSESDMYGLLLQGVPWLKGNGGAANSGRA